MLIALPRQNASVIALGHARAGFVFWRLATIPRNRVWLGLATAVALAVMLSISMARTGLASAQEQTLVVEGSVSNGTEGGGSIDGLAVILHQLSDTSREEVETVTDADGRFRFDGVAYDAAIGYGVSVLYQGVMYGRDVDLSQGSPDPVTLTVYDAIQDDSVISVVSASVLLAGLDAETQTISALEIIALENRSDRAFVPGAEPTQLLRFGLPPGATGLEVDTGLATADIVQIDRGFALFANVPPGESQVMLGYSFPYQGSDSTIEKLYRYGAENVRMLAPLGMMSITSDELGAPSSITLGERQYQLLEANGFERGATVTLRMSGLPTNSLGSRVSDEVSGIRFEYAPPVALGVMMAALLAYGVFWRGRGKPQPVLDTDEETAQEREIVHRMIEELEQSHGSGEIGQDEFRRRVGALNARLAKLR